MFRLTRFIGVLLLFAVLTNAQAFAKVAEVDARTFVASSMPQPNLDFNSISKELNSVEEMLKSSTVEPKTISKYVSYLGNVRAQVQEARKVQDEDLKNINRRIDSLGEVPKDGGEELPIIAEKRKEYNEESVYQKGRIAESDILITRIEELTSLILVVRKQALIGNLLVYQDPLIYPSNILKATGQFFDFAFNIIKSPVIWYLDLDAAQKSSVHSNILPVLFVVMLFLAIGVFLRKIIIKHLGYRKDIIDPPPYFSKVIAAFFVACAYGIIPAVLLGSLLIWMIHTKLLVMGFFGLLVSSLLYYTLVILLANAAIRVVFAPYNPMWRLVVLDDVRAKKITKAFYFAFFIIGLFSMLLHIASEANYTLELVYFLSFATSSLKAVCIVMVIRRFFWDQLLSEHSLEADSRGEYDDEHAEGSARNAFRIIFVSVVFAVGVIGVSLFGYPRLSEFIVNRALLSLLVISAAVIIRRALFELIRRLLLFNFWVKTFRMRRELIAKLDFWLNVIINPIFALSALLVILGLWGVSTDLLLQSVKKLFLGFKVGGVEISLLAIILGIVIFFIGISIVRIMRRRLLENILSHVDMDDGIKHSLASGFGFIGFVLSTILAIAVMGGDLGNIALVAGALSVGIGFGLQNVVNNFVSGIILLFERPVKVGDWVIINGEEGKIKQINIRSTELETFKRSSVIIPNANLIANEITNLTHGNNYSRFSIKVGVAYGSDADKVTNILMDAAKSHKKVLKNPAPFVVFLDFGPSSLDFELRCYTNDIWTGYTIPSDLRYDIYKRFEKEDVEIPFPQLVVHHPRTHNYLSQIEENENANKKP